MTSMQWDLVTYPGLVAAVIALVGGLKKLFPIWTDGREPLLGLVLSYVLGIGSKLTIPGAFATVHWLVFILSLLLVAVGAKLGHDYFVNQIMRGRPDGSAPVAKLLLASIILFTLIGCACPAEKAAVERLESQHEKLFTRYVEYAGKDPTYDAKTREDDQKWFQSIRSITTSLKKALED